jgi:hypothetical protein
VLYQFYNCENKEVFLVGEDRIPFFGAFTNILIFGMIKNNAVYSE